MNLSPTARWHLKKIGIVGLVMYGWAYFTDDDFFNINTLLLRLVAWALITVLYLLAVRFLKFGPPE
jgi:hypothetical protein